VSGKVNEQLTLEEVQQSFRTALKDFAEQLKDLTGDLSAIEIITAYGETTFNIETHPSVVGTKRFDITDLANLGKTTISGDLTILARTRMELDGDLLVILPTTKTIRSLSSNPPTVTTTGTGDSDKTGTGGSDKTGTGGSDTTTDNMLPTTNIKENEQISINHEILNLHNENVSMAIDNLKFVYGKIMDIASKVAESTGAPNNILRMFGKK
jgi:hypothetical protein